MRVVIVHTQAWIKCTVLICVYDAMHMFVNVCGVCRQTGDRPGGEPERLVPGEPVEEPQTVARAGTRLQHRYRLLLKRRMWCNLEAGYGGGAGGHCELFPSVSRRRHSSLFGATAADRLGADVAADGREGANEHAQYVAGWSGEWRRQRAEICFPEFLDIWWHKTKGQRSQTLRWTSTELIVCHRTSERSSR